ncbi:single stranded DNA-binding domain-containing protein [Vibrio gangliei]|uniref:hypothetical protein n=1 Tax=Vibrio gangliei TaxID=2077090 RepID=UPI000D01A115|nr:hypothetical protein [Vibrio gangliei]
MNTFNHNSGIVGGSVVSKKFNEQAGLSSVWLRKPNKNGKDTFIEIRLDGVLHANINDWLLVQGQVKNQNKTTFVDVKVDYGILGVATGQSELQVNQFQLSGLVSKVDCSGEWASISLAAKTTQKIGNEYKDETQWVNLRIKSQRISKLNIAKGDFLYVDCACSTSKYNDNEGKERVSYTFFINRVLTHSSKAKRAPAQPQQYQNAPQNNQQYNPVGGNFTPPSI